MSAEHVEERSEPSEYCQGEEEEKEETGPEPNEKGVPEKDEILII